MVRPQTCSRTAYLRRMLRNGRIVAAKQQAVSWLREGYASGPFLALIADLLDPSKRSQDRRPRRPPLQWLAIGETFETLHNDGFTRQQAVLILASRFRRSASFIETTLAYYRQARSDRPPAAPGPQADIRTDEAQASDELPDKEVRNPISHPSLHVGPNHHHRR